MHQLARTLSILALSGLFFFAAPITVAAALININTADVETLDTLPGIGPAKAEAIIAYRTEHGPFAAIEDIQSVSGIGPATFADISPLITVGTAGANTTGGGQAASTTPPAAATSTTSAGSVAAIYVPPSSFSIDIGGDRAVLLHVATMFKATVKNKSGSAVPAITWSFGDGSSAEGALVSKTYRYPGTYLVVARVGGDTDRAEASIVVTVVPAAVRIAQIDPDGITIANDGKGRLDLSGWHLTVETGFSFRFPPGTVLLPESQGLFPWTVIRLPVSSTATLAYPDGVIAGQYQPLKVPEILAATSTPPRASESLGVALALPEPQPGATLAGSPLVQTVDAALTSVRNPLIPAVETEAPGVANQLAAAGAAAPPFEPVTSSRDWLRSPWVLGLLGVAAALGSALMIM